MDISQLGRRVFGVIHRNSPVILTGLGVAGAVSTTILAIRGTYKARHTLEQILEDDDFTKREKVKLIIQNTWPAYLPVTGVLFGTIAAIVGAQGINSKRQAILISAVTMGERALQEYQDKVVAIDGGKTDQKVQEAIIEDHLRDNPPPDILLDEDGNPIFIEGQGQLVYDDWGGRYFHSTQESIRQAMNDVNDALIRGDFYASLNDFYSALGQKPVAGGEDVGWTAERLIEINFTPKLLTEGRTCLVFGFAKKPLRDYDRFH